MAPDGTGHAVAVAFRPCRCMTLLCLCGQCHLPLQVAAEEAGSQLVKIHSKKDYDSLINSGGCSVVKYR